MKSGEIIEVLADVVSKTSEDCIISLPDYKGGVIEVKCPKINYIFGNAQYIKERLDELSRTPVGNELKFPLIALFCPFTEERKDVDHYTKAKIRLLIACPSNKEWSNEERLETSFKSILRPIYKGFLNALEADHRLDWGYKPHIAHEYSENYSYGRYGAVTASGEQVSEPIDAINITNLEIKVKQTNCTLI